MFSRKDYLENQEAVSAIKTITSIYQEIALIRINQLKDGSARLREFLEGVAEVYSHAKVAYISEIQASRGKKDLKSLSFIKRNGRTVLVLLSANEHLYGSIVLETWNQFREDLKNSKNDGVVVGGFGKYLAKNESITNRMTYFDLNDDKPGKEEIATILKYISSYEQIVVYYGEMISILNQQPAKAQISGGVTLESKLPLGKKYIFEPSPETILEFFESEIIGAIFTQKIFEHRLARLAARMVAMDQATENAKELLKKLHKEFVQLKKRVSNSKQLQVYAGMSVWGEEE